MCGYEWKCIRYDYSIMRFGVFFSFYCQQFDFIHQSITFHTYIQQSSAIHSDIGIFRFDCLVVLCTRYCGRLSKGSIAIGATCKVLVVLFQLFIINHSCCNVGFMVGFHLKFQF